MGREGRAIYPRFALPIGFLWGGAYGTFRRRKEMMAANERRSSLIVAPRGEKLKAASHGSQ